MTRHKMKNEEVLTHDTFPQMQSAALVSYSCVQSSARSGRLCHYEFMFLANAKISTLFQNVIWFELCLEYWCTAYV